MIRGAFIVAVMISVASCAVGQTLLEKNRALQLKCEGTGSGIEVGVAAALKGDRPRSGMSAAKWGIAWKEGSGRSDSLVLQWGNTDFGMDGDRRFLRVTCGGRSQDIFDMLDGQESVALSMTADSHAVTWCVGQDRIKGNGSVERSPEADIVSVELFCQGKNLIVDRVDACRFADHAVDGMTSRTSADDFPVPEDIVSSPAGVWQYLDRDNDPAWSRPGGKYTLGVVADEDCDGVWTIVYLDGAVTHADRWRAGMKKGRLAESGFLRDYNLEWIDATYTPMGRDDECSARLSDDGMILTLVFPLDKATLRFSRRL